MHRLVARALAIDNCREARVGWTAGRTPSENAMTPRFFANPEEMRAWMQENHGERDEQWVGYYKKASGIPSITWAESVDVALCFGWIDGIRKRVDEMSFKIRFTPRRRGSAWSARNIARMNALLADGLAEPAGRAAFAARSPSAPKGADRLSPEFQARLEARTAAWRFFEGLSPSLRKQSVAWVTAAKRQETRERRLETLIAASAEGKLIPPLQWTRRPSDRSRPSMPGPQGVASE